jgi:hypothetical protein
LHRTQFQKTDLPEVAQIGLEAPGANFLQLTVNPYLSARAQSLTLRCAVAGKLQHKMFEPCGRLKQQTL